MSTFDVEKFLAEDVTRIKLLGLTKPNLFELVDFCEETVAPETTKIDIVNVVGMVWRSG